MGVEVTSSGAVSGGPSDPQEEAPRRGLSALSLGRTQRAPAPALASSLRLPAHLLTTTTTSSSAARRHNGNIAARPPPPAPPGCIFLSTCSTTLRYGTPTGLRRRSRPITISLSACCCYNDVPLGSCVRRCDAAWRPPVHIMRIFSLPRLFIFLVFPSDSPFCLLAS